MDENRLKSHIYSNIADNGDGTYWATLYADNTGDGVPDFQLQIHFMNGNITSDGIIG